MREWSVAERSLIARRITFAAMLSFDWVKLTNCDIEVRWAGL